jgi:hypothetical protein
MPQTPRIFRVFVSSTFSDLKVERNVLQARVFPRLQRLAQENGCRFQAVDLRWGISSEAALDQQTMKICLGEIARCQTISPKPNFIILMGDRYGWRPLPYEIPNAEFQQILKEIHYPFHRHISCSPGRVFLKIERFGEKKKPYCRPRWKGQPKERAWGNWG